MSTRDLVLEMLSQGLPPSVVAGTIGVTESAISQLMSDEDFAAEVQAKRVAQSKEDQQYDQKLDRAEETFLDRIEQKSGMANLQQSMQAFKILNGAKRKKERSTGPATQNIGTIVNITLPVIVAPKYLLNQQSEIVEVEGKTMVSATPKSLDALVAAKKPAPTVLPQKLADQLEIALAERTLVTLDKVGPVTKSSRRQNIFSVDML